MLDNVSVHEGQIIFRGESLVGFFWGFCWTIIVSEHFTIRDLS